VAANESVGFIYALEEALLLGELLSLIVLVDLCSVVFDLLRGFFAFHFSTVESEVSRSEVSRSFQVRQRPTSTGSKQISNILLATRHPILAISVRSSILNLGKLRMESK
jgi:hypothetical protein